tara:strand:- start:414 stop:1445 length:1032 start_codon:yes stop_codon:yes gene_type:complete
MNDIIKGVVASCMIGGVASAYDGDALDQIRSNMLANASTHASLQGTDSPVTANVHGFVQTRYTYSSGANDVANYGFSVPRARLAVTGLVYDFDYRVSGQWSDGGNFELLDAWGSTDFESVNFKFGQFKTPFMREVLVYQADILGIEKSIISSTFGQGRSQGLQLSHDFGPLTASASYSDGFNTANGVGVQNGYAATGRLDWTVTDWMNLGGAVSYNQQDTTYWTWTADAGFIFGDLTLDGAYVSAEYDSGRQWGANGQLGYHITEELQPYAQYQYGELGGSTKSLSIVTGGFNYFFNSNVKFGADFGYALNGIAAGWNTGQTGWRTSTESGEYLVRGQLQIRF